MCVHLTQINQASIYLFVSPISSKLSEVWVKCPYTPNMLSVQEPLHNLYIYVEATSCRPLHKSTIYIYTCIYCIVHQLQSKTIMYVCKNDWPWNPSVSSMLSSGTSLKYIYIDIQSLHYMIPRGTRKLLIKFPLVILGIIQN